MEFPRIPPNFDSALDTTRELRDFYMAQATEYERLLEHARTQLFHAEALLSGLEKLQPEAIAPSQVIAMSVTNGNGRNAGNHTQQQLSTEPNFASGNRVDSISTVIAAVLNSESEEESSVDSEVELLPPYEDLTLFDANCAERRSAAIAKLLQENAGTILKLDFIVRSLYGKLPASQLVTVTEQVKRSLEAGVEEGRWQRDSLNHPDNTDCYTWNLPLKVELTPSALFTPTELSNSNDIDEESLALPIVDGVMSEKEFLELVEKGILNFDKMKQIAQKFQFRSYGTIKSSKAFAAFLGKKSIKRSVIQRFF